jgi:hypothetical protein
MRKSLFLALKVPSLRSKIGQPHHALPLFDTPAYDLYKLWSDPPIAEHEICIEGDPE